MEAYLRPQVYINGRSFINVMKPVVVDKLPCYQIYIYINYNI